MTASNAAAPPPTTTRPRVAPKESAGRNTHARVYEALRAHLDSGRVLEIPCGTGAFLRRVAGSGGAYRPVGADLDPAVLGSGIPSLVADMAGGLPVEAGCLDAVVSIEGIEHIRRPFDFVGECRRVLKPGGLLFLTTPNTSSARSRWRWFMTGFHNKSNNPLDESRPALRHHITMLSFPELRYMLHTQGFEIVGIGTNRVKAAAWLYAPWWPVQCVAAALAFRKRAKNPEHRRIIREVHRQMLRPAVFFGESLLLIARAR